MKIKYLFFSAVALGGVMSGCKGDSDEPGHNVNFSKEFERAKTTELNEGQKAMIDAQGEFNCEFFKQVVAQSKDANLVVSPVSMSMDLAMLANGAGGETLKELHKVLGAESATQDDFNTLNNLLYTALPTVDSKANVSLANSIWVNNGLKLNAPFVNVCAKKYDASVRNVDMFGNEALVEINKWAENKTNGLIKNFLQESPSAMVTLMNALYFKAPWMSSFDAKKTAKGDFYGEAATTKVDFMEHKEMNCYISGSSIGNVISFPFGNGAYSLTIVSPYEGVSKAVNSLTPQILKRLCSVSNQQLQKEWVKLPKFKLDYKNNELASVLGAMGLKKAVTAEADFSAMSNAGLMISKVIQAVNFSIDENGGKGAAVSGIVMDGAAGSIEEPQPTVINRPFIFLVSEKTTGSILFMGKVTQL